jgi:hypothetical protein
VEILIDDGTVSHDFDELDDLTHAYTISVHGVAATSASWLKAGVIGNDEGAGTVFLIIWRREPHDHPDRSCSHVAVRTSTPARRIG